MKLLLLLLLFFSCSLFNTDPRGDLSNKERDERDLPFHEKDTSYNILILVDLEVIYSKPLPEWEQHLQYFLWNLYRDRQLLVALSPIDNRYQFVYGSNRKELSPKHKELPIGDLKAIKLTAIEKVKREKTPGISYALNKLRFLSSNGYFAPNLDTHVIIISPNDDWDYYTNMSGHIVKDHYPDRLSKLKMMNKDIYTGKLEKIRYYNFDHLRFHTISRHNKYCSKGRKDFYRYRMASRELYEHYVETVEPRTWPDYYNYCNQSLNKIFKSIFESIRQRKFVKKLSK